MKKLITLIVVSIFMISCSTTKGTTKQEPLLSKAIEKVTSMQKLIKFSDKQAEKLKKLEFDYLKKVQSLKKDKISKDLLKKRLQELNIKKDKQLQEILERDQYLKYDAIENDRLKKGIIMAD